jgi:SAM-dependent methyltransferase
LSIFSSVDTADDPDRALRYLEQTAIAASGIKHYVMAAHAMREPSGLVLDVGCGSGHDLVLLGSAGIKAVGVDPSALLLGAARERTTGFVPLVRAAGEALPFRDGSFAGCRIERVLMHVLDPSVVVGEIARCLRSGGLITAFEPDWNVFRVRAAADDELCGWICSARHPGVGGTLWELLEASGCVVVDRVEELSIWRSLDVLDRVVGLAPSLERAVVAERVSRARADGWLREQQERDASGEFFAAMTKVLVVARKP